MALALLLSLKNNGRITCLLVGPLWAFVALAFFIQRYADPTALTTLGLVLITFKGWLLWLNAMVPLLWLLISGLTLLALDALGAVVLFTAVETGLMGLIWKSVKLR
jgi:hypothetical protein